MISFKEILGSVLVFTRQSEPVTWLSLGGNVNWNVNCFSLSFYEMFISLSLEEESPSGFNISIQGEEISHFRSLIEVFLCVCGQAGQQYNTWTSSTHTVLWDRKKKCSFKTSCFTCCYFGIFYRSLICILTNMTNYILGHQYFSYWFVDVIIYKQ